MSRRPITSRVYLMDGKYHTLTFSPNEIARNLVSVLLTKIGLNAEASSKGYAIYESSSNWERSLMQEEKPAEVMARWEKQRNAAASQSNTNGVVTIPQFKFILKKHLLVDGWMDLNQPVEKELIYHQLLASARKDKLPISDTEAVSKTVFLRFLDEVLS